MGNKNTYSMKERFLRVLDKKEVDKVPVCSPTQTGTLELMDMTNTSWPKAHYDSEEMARLALAGHTVLGFEAVRYPFSSFDIPVSLGCKYSEGTFNSQPHQIDFPVKELKDAKNITIPENFFEVDLVKVIMNTTDLLVKEIEKLDEEVPLMVGILGPASISSCLAGINNYLMWCIQEPDTLKSLMEIGTEICIKYSNALYDSGVDTVVIIDSEAGPDLFPPKLYESMVLPEHKKINKKVKEPSVFHICGDATNIFNMIKKSGFIGLSIEEKVRVKEATDIIGKDMAVIGNVSPTHKLLLKQPEDVYEVSINCIEDGIDILAPGCGLAPATPSENVKAIIRARDDYFENK